MTVAPFCMLLLDIVVVIREYAYPSLPRCPPPAPSGQYCTERFMVASAETSRDHEPSAFQKVGTQIATSCRIRHSRVPPAFMVWSMLTRMQCPRDILRDVTTMGFWKVYSAASSQASERSQLRADWRASHVYFKRFACNF